MAKQQEQRPELIILATDARDIYHRFHGWPDLLATDGDYAKVLSIPIFDDLPLADWKSELEQSTRNGVQGLHVSVMQLQAAWEQQQLPRWSGVAHSLLLHFLLWGIGGRLLLNHYGQRVGAVVVNSLENGNGAIWQGFVRANQEYGISCLLGRDYSNSSELRNLLSQPDVAKTLATLNGNGMMLLSQPSATRILRRLGALENGRTDGLYRVAWPTLEATHLSQVRPVLQGCASSLLLALQHTVVPLVELTVPSLRGFMPIDIAVAAFALLVGRLAENWLDAHLLPPTVQPLLDGLL